MTPAAGGGHTPRGTRAAAARRPWIEAGIATIRELTHEVRHQADVIADAADDDAVDDDAVHDMRTATRRLRTAIDLYRDATPGRRRRRVQDELRRVARRLGAVRDLDVLIAALDDATARSGRIGDDLDPLRHEWRNERSRSAKRLRAEVGHRRFGRALDHASGLTAGDASGLGEGPRRGRIPRVAHKAPGLVWDAFGALLAFDLDPARADPALVHEMRISAKKLRYTLEAFDDALGRGTSTLIDQVTALQDAAGEMHDAVVARDRARSFLDRGGLTAVQRRAIGAFATAQDRRATRMRGRVGRTMRSVRSRDFRTSLDRAIAGMRA